MGILDPKYLCREDRRSPCVTQPANIMAHYLVDYTIKRTFGHTKTLTQKLSDLLSDLKLSKDLILFNINSGSKVFHDIL